MPTHYLAGNCRVIRFASSGYKPTLSQMVIFNTPEGLPILLRFANCKAFNIDNNRPLFNGGNTNFDEALK
jgi:hypothetical protein